MDERARFHIGAARLIQVVERASHNHIDELVGAVIQTQDGVIELVKNEIRFWKRVHTSANLGALEHELGIRRALHVQTTVGESRSNSSSNAAFLRSVEHAHSHLRSTGVNRLARCARSCGAEVIRQISHGISTRTAENAGDAEHGEDEAHGQKHECCTQNHLLTVVNILAASLTLCLDISCSGHVYSSFL